MLNVSPKSHFLSLEQTITDLSILGRYLGPRLAKYGQKSQKRPEYHNYPSETRSQNDFLFYDKSGKRVIPEKLEDIDTIVKMSVTFKVQKNRRNEETKEVLLADTTNTTAMHSKSQTDPSDLINLPTSRPASTKMRSLK